MQLATEKHDVNLDAIATVENNEGIVGHKKKTLTAKNKLALALLLLAILIVVACAAILTALYAPQHMPNVIADIVAKLSPVAHDAILGLAYGVGALGLLGVAYTSKAIHDKKPLNLSLNCSGFGSNSLFANKDKVSTAEITKNLGKDEPVMLPGDEPVMLPGDEATTFNPK